MLQRRWARRPHYPIPHVTEEVGQAYEFGITSLTNRKDYLQQGDSVAFQVEEGGQRAVNITIQRKRHRATVDAFKSEWWRVGDGNPGQDSMTLSAYQPASNMCVMYFYVSWLVFEFRRRTKMKTY